MTSILATPVKVNALLVSSMNEESLLFSDDEVFIGGATDLEVEKHELLSTFHAARIEEVEAEAVEIVEALPSTLETMDNSAQLQVFEQATEERSVRNEHVEASLQERHQIYQQKLELIRKMRAELASTAPVQTPATSVSVKPRAAWSTTDQQKQKERILELQAIRQKIEAERVEFENRLEAQQLDQPNDEHSQCQSFEQENHLESSVRLSFSPIVSSVRKGRLTWADDLGLKLNDSTDLHFTPTKPANEVPDKVLSCLRTSGHTSKAIRPIL